MRNPDGYIIAIVMGLLAVLCLTLAAYSSMRDVRNTPFPNILNTPDLTR